MSQYKTLREIDGQQYISLAEHEEIVKSVGDLLKALRDVQSTVGDVRKATTGLASIVGYKG